MDAPDVGFKTASHYNINTRNDDDDYDDKPLMTEEEEQEIRQVASDINEKAFYGKILKTKQAIQVDSEFARLSPRS